jgi:signal transduction histidine kinase
MPSRWSIRNKLIVCLAMLLVSVAILSFSSFRGVYAYRCLARGISRRALELPLALELARNVSNLRTTLNGFGDQSCFPDAPSYAVDMILWQYFEDHLARAQQTVAAYRRQLADSDEEVFRSSPIAVSRSEWETLLKTESSLQAIDTLLRDEGLSNVDLEALERELASLLALSTELPGFLQTRMHTFARDVRMRYRTWIVLTWVTSVGAGLLLCLLGRMAYCWIFRPLRTIIHGSRYVASGDFAHQIRVASHDEMAELATAMNEMTRRFRAIRDDLDEQVRQRTREVVRSEQMASVGFLAAGVAHEINNPLASIALCAESLEDRLRDIIPADDALPDEDHNHEIDVLRNYLRMIQDEAFRCKQITERLLDFSRLGNVEKQPTELRGLVADVIEMLGHIGKYKDTKIRFLPGDELVCVVNAQEIKQVVLNLLTNALHSLDPGGKVEVRLTDEGGSGVLTVKDNGCGMTDEVQRHLFEPFFTQRRDGQGTGLGMSISYRIVSEHGGTITAQSDGPGKGSLLTVKLPSAEGQSQKERQHYYKAA